MKKHKSASLSAIATTRKRIRYQMEKLALSHRGCAQARGCGCEVDQALAILDDAESKLFRIELAVYSRPDMPRRIVASDNTVTLEQDFDSASEVEP